MSSFEVLPGEVQCIAGENGSGKSTLIKVITGVYQPAAGQPISIDGKPVDAHVAGAWRARRAFEVIWQDLALFNEMTVAENIAIEAVLGAVPRLVDHAAMRRTALDVLDTAWRRPRCRCAARHVSRLRSGRSWPSRALWSARRKSSSWMSRLRR